MCPSLAEPDSGGFPRSNFGMFHTKHHIKIKQSWLQATSRGQIKVFRCSSFSKMLPRCGRAAHICGANYFCNLFFLLQLHFLKLTNSQLNCLCETSCKFGQGNGAIAARWQAKAGVEPPFAGRERLFSLRIISKCFTRNITSK